MRKNLFPFIILFVFVNTTFAQEPQPQVTDVWVVFKTHFDLGYTDLPENVFARYRGEMMDKALKVIEKNTQLPAESVFSGPGQNVCVSGRNPRI
jgi:hypothetical protein